MSESPAPMDAPPPFFKIFPIMAGQSYRMATGQVALADDDMVLFDIIDPAVGHVAQFTLEVDSAIQLAATLSMVGTMVLRQQIDDDGRKLPLHVRLARINAAHQAARDEIARGNH